MGNLWTAAPDCLQALLAVSRPCRSVFVPFALYYMKQPIKLDYLWAALCMCGAVYFVFRS